MNESKTIVFTGGGTAGHVLPNFPLIERFIANNWEIKYVGSKDGIESKIVQENFPNIEYKGITCDKLRRYVTYKHLFVPFKLSYGLFEAIRFLRKVRPKLIFSKGGFVSVPVCFAGWILGIPIVTHESDYSVGLANRIIFPMSKLIGVSFDKSIYGSGFKKRMIQVGPLIRQSFIDKKKPDNMVIDFADKSKKTLLFMGGSIGAQSINLFIESNLKVLTDRFNIIHIRGKKNSFALKSSESYKVFDYLNDGLSYLISISDLVVSRAGANSIWETLILKKPMILIPLSKKSSRGDQIENAEYFKKLGVVEVLEDDSLNLETLNALIEEIFNKYNLYLSRIANLDLCLGDEKLYEAIMNLI
jgi:UDP-N-acetylglucosamine--N-acetylmuramyl-(pentapeptide) pyrophosphoryl-undecaprenol N-acetylglucosamine transferase